MSEARFTKGPWRIQDDRYNLIGVRIERGFGILVGGKSKENIADSHLIAAAPEMYAMLDSLLSLEGIIKTDKIKDLLSKARGEA